MTKTELKEGESGNKYGPELWWEYMNGEIAIGRLSLEYANERAIENGFLRPHGS